jgi:uncharacterized delta-60 repeat protein
MRVRATGLQRVLTVLAGVTLAATTTTSAQATGAVRDASFGHNGAVRTAVDADAFGWAVARQPDGKIVVAGQAAPADHSWSAIAVVRYLADGELDGSFGVGGRVTTRIKDYDGAAAVMLQPDGKIVVAGHTIKAGGVPQVALARYGSDGSLDLTFGPGGTDVVPGTTGWLVAGAALDDSGDVVVNGSVPVNGFGKLFVARVLPTGGLDPSFGNNGTVILHLSKPTENDGGNAVALLPDGRIVVAGTARSGRYAVVRFNHDGTLDDSFANGGKFVGGPNGFATSLALTPSRQVVAAGWYFPRSGGADNGAAVLMLGAHGHLLRAFGRNGVSRYHSPEDAGAFSVVYRPSDDSFSVIGSLGTQRDPSDLLLLHYAYGSTGWERDWTSRLDYGGFDSPVSATNGGGRRLVFAGGRSRTLTGDDVMLVGRLRVPR